MDIKKKLQDEIAALEYETAQRAPQGNPEGPGARRSERKRRVSRGQGAAGHGQRPLESADRAAGGAVHGRFHQRSRTTASGWARTVVVLDVKKDEEITYTLVTSEEADAADGKISTTSPIGRGLLGKEVGDMVKVTDSGRCAGAGNSEADHHSRYGRVAV